MSHLTKISVVLAVCASATAQESYWVANRSSSDVMEISACGHVQQTIPLGFSGGGAWMAPDGKVWVAQAFASNIRILNSNGTTFLDIVFGSGSVSSMAFDAGGHAWISGTNAVEEFDANGLLVQVFPLTQAAPLGITIDADGNKWIAHRYGPPGGITRIDGTTGAVLPISLPANSLILPTDVYADQRGIGMSSHIWVTGDNRGAGELVEYDSTGMLVNLHVLGSTVRANPIVGDIDAATLATGSLWVSEWGTSMLHRIDPATGTVTSSFTGSRYLELAIDGFGNLWGTTDNGPSAAGTVDRIDSATGLPDFASPVGIRPSKGLATLWHHATVVDPLGDLDGDLEPNLIEIMTGSSPFDAASRAARSVEVGGPTTFGATSRLDVLAGPTDPTGVLVALGTLPAAGISVPGLASTFELDPALMLPVSVGFVGPGGIGLPLGTTVVGTRVFFQGVNLTALSFTNVACLEVF